MKIVFYISSMAPAGGIERVLSKHINFLSAENEIILITDDKIKSFYPLPENIIHVGLDIDTKLSLEDSKIERILKIVGTFYANIKKLRQQIKVVTPDVVYTAHPLNLLKIVFSFRKLEKIIVTEHASINSYNSVYKKIATVFYKKVKILAVPTKLDSDIYNSLGIPNVYLPNPLSFYPSESAALENKVALNIGRFTDDKQHLLLLELWSKSEAMANGWKLKIIGEGENYDSIISKIKELKLEENVIIQSPTKEIIEEYLNSSLFLLTSRAEGFGLVLAEAMACGVPCISFNCPSGPRDIINDRKDGFLIEVGDLEDYVQKINLLTGDINLRKNLGKNAKMSISQFSASVIKEKLNDLVNSNFKPSKW